jgi:hypothetical protein
MTSIQKTMLRGQNGNETPGCPVQVFHRTPGSRERRGRNVGNVGVGERQGRV